MKKGIQKGTAAVFCISACLSAVLLLLTDLAVVFFGGEIPVPAAALLLAGLTALLYVPCRRYRKQVLSAAGICLAILGAGLLAGYLCWSSFSRNSHYLYPDSGKNQVYGDRTVMVIVPHQDDELNILGGVMEEYVRYGSSLYAVFVTNGDYVGLTETRYQEAVTVFEHLGVPEDHVIFLGYGNEWAQDGPHIYNAPSGQILHSYIGKTQTYGTEDHPAYRQGQDYTIDNLLADMKNVILEYRPDVIFCSDYDHHIDHRATTLLFEKAMGQLLKEVPDYQPVVYKAYAYGTAWEAEADYYADHVKSTQNPFAEPYLQQPVVYRWENRVRFPVDGASLSRSLVGSRAYDLLQCYDSQGAWVMAASVLNGDKVAWRRYTDSLCLRGEVTVSSGDAGLLNDFMLTDNHDLMDASHDPYDGVWIPDQEDAEKTATVTLRQPSDIVSIVLYDHPQADVNVRNAEICFDDGTRVETGPLDPGGAATTIAVEKKDVKSFSVSLLETEGGSAGLSELEAFGEEPDADGQFVKLTDTEGNFLYDCITAPDGTVQLSLYLHGDLPAVTADQYTVATGQNKGQVTLENGVIDVRCPGGEEMVLNVTCSQAGVSDSILIRNPGRMERMWTALWQQVEAALFARISRGDHNRLLMLRILEKIGYVLRHL